MDCTSGSLLRVGLAILMWVPVVVWGEAPQGTPTSDDIVRRLVERNKIRADLLKRYADERHYKVVYHGFPRSLSAEMVVKVTYEAPATKHFQIMTQTGSKVLVERVLKKLLEGEEEATRDQGQSALTPANYRFEFLGQEERAGRPCFIFHVEPRAESKFLYRGTVWIDVQDSAVAQIDAVPAKNPSFWIKHTTIHHTYEKSGQFWLPHSDRSETAVRLGGTAELTIAYGPYETTRWPTAKSQTLVARRSFKHGCALSTGQRGTVDRSRLQVSVAAPLRELLLMRCSPYFR